MDRLAVISDIHGNITGTKAVLDALDSEGYEGKLVVAGDIVTGGSGESNLLKLLMERDSDFIRGNMEDYLRSPQFTIGNIKQVNRRYVSEWYDRLKENLTEDEWTLLIKAPLTRKYQVGSKRILVCHAAPNDPWAWSCFADAPEDVLYKEYGLVSADIIVYGHYHKNHVMEFGGKLLVNVAGVGLRRDGLSHYTVIEDIDGEVRVRQEAISYDTELEKQLDDAAGLPVFGS